MEKVAKDKVKVKQALAEGEEQEDVDSMGFLKKALVKKHKKDKEKEELHQEM